MGVDIYFQGKRSERSVIFSPQKTPNRAESHRSLRRSVGDVQELYLRRGGDDMHLCSIWKNVSIVGNIPSYPNLILNPSLDASPSWSSVFIVLNFAVSRSCSRLGRFTCTLHIYIYDLKSLKVDKWIWSKVFKSRNMISRKKQSQRLIIEMRYAFTRFDLRDFGVRRTRGGYAGLK